MKLFKEKLHLLAILAITLIISSCSDVTDVDDFDIEAENLTTSTPQNKVQRQVPDCSEPYPLLGSTVSFIVEYAPHLGIFEKRAIRLRHASRIACVDYSYEPENSNVEIWNYVICPLFVMCKPSAERPDDPDILSVTDL